MRKSKVSVHQIKRLLPSLVTFFAGTGALVVVDAVIARFAPIDAVERWVALKALVMLAGAIAVTGLDQVLLREPGQAKKLLLWATLNITLVAALSALIADASGYYQGAGSAFLSILGVAFSVFAFAWQRTRLRITKAQLARDGWKLILLLLLWPVHFHVGLPLEWVLVISLAMGLSFCLLPHKHNAYDQVHQVHYEVRNYRDALVSGAPFLASSAALAVASYGELLLVRTFGSAREVETYFLAAILFSYPSMMFNGYISAMLGPAIRQNPQSASRMLKSSTSYLVAAAAVMPLGAIALGYLLEPLIFPEGSTSLWLACLLSLTAGLRFAYAIISSFVGTLANARQLRSVTAAYVGGAMCTVPLCAALIWTGADILASIAITALLHSVFRMTIGWRLTARLADHHTSARQV